MIFLLVKNYHLIHVTTYSSTGGGMGHQSAKPGKQQQGKQFQIPSSEKKGREVNQKFLNTKFQSVIGIVAIVSLPMKQKKRKENEKHGEVQL